MYKRQTYISAVSADGKVVATCTVNVSKPVVNKPAKVKIKSAKKKGKKVTLCLLYTSRCV